MIIETIKTHKITKDDTSINSILDKYITELNENEIVAITSKIISICEGNIILKDSIDKNELIQKEADLFIPPENNLYKYTLTMKNNFLAFTSGIDESNGNGYYILWPKDSQKTANNIREYLSKKFNIKNVGVIITDSSSFPLKKGTMGIALAHSGFSAINNYIDKNDIFGKKFRVTKSNISQSIAAASVLTMGEGDEQTPMAIVKKLPFVNFQDRNPTTEELDELVVTPENDLYYELFKNIKWSKHEKNI